VAASISCYLSTGIWAVSSGNGIPDNVKISFRKYKTNPINCVHILQQLDLGTGVKYTDANQFCFLIFAASKTGKDKLLLKISWQAREILTETNRCLIRYRPLQVN